MGLSQAPLRTPLFTPELKTKDRVWKWIVAASSWSGWFDELVRKVNNTYGGTATFVGAATVAVTLARVEVDTSYRVTVTMNVDERIWVTNKTTTGFTLNSSNAASTASPDYIISRG